MSTRNWNFQRKNSIKWTVKTATATLTKSEIDHGIVIANHGTTAVVLTLPAATSLYKGNQVIIANKGAEPAKVYCEAGFGGAGGSYDYVTLAQGDAYEFFCEGSYWYDTGHSTASGS